MINAKKLNVSLWNNNKYKYDHFNTIEIKKLVEYMTENAEMGKEIEIANNYIFYGMRRTRI